MTSRSDGTAVGCTFCGCGGWNLSPSARGPCLHVGALRTAPATTCAWVCIACDHQTDDWNAATKHYHHTAHGFVSTEQRGDSHQETPRMKRFKKINWNEKRIALEWTTSQDTETHDHELTCADAPRPEFTAALQALRDDVLVICDLDDSYGEGMRVQSVSLSLNAKTGGRGAVVTAMKALPIANAPLALHTPHLSSEKAGDDEGGAEDGDRSGVMPDGMWKRIEALEAEAWAYLDGKRAPKAQTELPLAGAKEPELAGAGV